MTTPRLTVLPASRSDLIDGSGPRQWFHTQLHAIANGKHTVDLAKGESLYSQGERANGVYFIERGKVRLSVLSTTGKEAILGILTPGDFCGEGCLSRQPLRMGSATAVSSSAVIRIERAVLARQLHSHPPLAEAFLARLLARNIAFEEDICDQLFNHSEKRLARTLLKLARFGDDTNDGHTHTITPKISQESLAEMIGTTRSRVNFFMNKFRRLGLIQYNGEIHVHPKLLTHVILAD